MGANYQGNLAENIVVDSGVNFYLIENSFITSGINVSSDIDPNGSFIIRKCIVGGNFDTYYYSLISNCIFTNRNNRFNYCQVQNCIFTYSATYYNAGSGNDATFINNIFSIPNSFSTSSTNCIFKNNLNCNLSGIHNLTGNQGRSNFYPGQIVDSLVVSYNTIAIRDYTYNFQLKPGSPYKNAGTDGTDIGVYGGDFPWEDGSVPNNPWIKKAIINTKTNNNGDLPVDIEVEAR